MSFYKEMVEHLAWMEAEIEYTEKDMMYHKSVRYLDTKREVLLAQQRTLIRLKGLYDKERDRREHILLNLRSIPMTSICNADYTKCPYLGKTDETFCLVNRKRCDYVIKKEE